MLLEIVRASPLLPHYGRSILPRHQRYFLAKLPDTTKQLAELRSTHAISLCRALLFLVTTWLARAAIISIMPFDFSGRVIAISGAASGIGFATAQYLYSAGASLSLTDVRKDALLAAVQRLVSTPSPTTDKELEVRAADRSTLLGNPNAKPDNSEIVHEDNRILAMTTNVAKSAQVDTWIDNTITKFGRLDGAANMAGISSKAAGIHPITEVSDSTLR